MSAREAVAILERLDERGIAVWLEGGWGVDALVGRETRAHDDVDVIVSIDEVDRLQEALRELAYERARGGPPLSFELVDTDGHQVDVHPVTFQPGGDAVYRMEDGRDWVYPAGSLSGRGTIAGRPVKCLAPDIALMCHSQGYALDAEHRRDVEALCEHFRLRLPAFQTT